MVVRASSRDVAISGTDKGTKMKVSDIIECDKSVPEENGSLKIVCS